MNGFDLQCPVQNYKLKLHITNMIFLPKKGKSLASKRITFLRQHSVKARYVCSIMSNCNAPFSRNLYSISDSEVKESSKKIDVDLSAAVKKLKSSTVRPFLLVTLSHCERRNISQSDVIERFNKLYSCRSILVSREPHERGGFHYHIGLETRNASKNNFQKLIRAAFPEFDGKQVNVQQARKGFGPICSYVTKFDKSPLIWGEYNLKQVLQKAKVSERFIKKTHLPLKTPSWVKKKLLKRALFSKLKWILLFQFINHLLSLEIPELLIFLWEKISLLYRYIEEIWEGPEAEPVLNVPESQNPSHQNSFIILMGFGCIAAFFIVKSLLRNNT